MPAGTGDEATGAHGLAQPVQLGVEQGDVADDEQEQVDQTQRCPEPGQGTAEAHRLQGAEQGGAGEHAGIDLDDQQERAEEALA